MIRKFAVTGLNDRMSFDLSLHDDVNIVTGKNGSGKTTVLKLMWSMLSGNLERIVPEIPFDKAFLETDSFSLQITSTKEEGARRLEWELRGPDGKAIRGTLPNPRSDRMLRLSRPLAQYSGSSLFFPTFRRIEGGFSTTRPHRNAREYDPEFPYYDSPYNIENALGTVSRHLTTFNHRFVASISTNDIVSTLTSQYANISEQLNQDHRELSTDIDGLIRTHQQQLDSNPSQSEKLQLAKTTLDEIRRQMTRHAQRQESLLAPFTALNDLIGRIFRHKGIRVTTRITLGDAQEAILSDRLSAGEKQMLSFLVYNAFETGAVIFIDEPEISLHVDWQRQLFPTLLAQNSRNQFIVATHSPFIYSQFADRELLLDQDRGA